MHVVTCIVAEQLVGYYSVKCVVVACCNNIVLVLRIIENHFGILQVPLRRPLCFEALS